MSRQDYSENDIKYLEMIESVIERMGQNSFSLKEWTMTLIVAICAFSAAGTEKRFALVAIAPIIVFWFLDSYYLLMERKYRELYKRATKHDAPLFTMDTREICGEKTHFLKCLFSVSECPFYLVCIVTTIAVFIWLIHGR